jgi:hypothetical protein
MKDVPEDYQGIISKEKPFEFETRNVPVNDELTINVHINEPANKELFMYIFENGLSVSGNSYILTPKTLLNRYYAYLTRATIIDNEYLGFALSVPHTLCLKEKTNLTMIRSGITTNLSVSANHRSERLAEYLIKAIIYKGWETNIYTGYHFIQVPRTPSNIVVYPYFRPLDIEKSIECGYTFQNRDFDLRDNTDYSIRESNFEDLTICEKVKRNLNIALTKEEYDNLRQDCDFYTVTHKSKVTGVIAVKSVLMHMNKVGKLCNVGRVVYIETLEKHAFHSIAKMFNLLKEKKFVVLSGVSFGSMNNEHLKKTLGIITTGKIYLDFYNLRLKDYNKNASEVNVLYI